MGGLVIPEVELAIGEHVDGFMEQVRSADSPYNIELAEIREVGLEVINVLRREAGDFALSHGLYRALEDQRFSPFRSLFLSKLGLWVVHSPVKSVNWSNFRVQQPQIDTLSTVHSIDGNLMLL